ncbi:3-deoxy-D-manno-octulosonic acid transferase [Synergistes jonesii]|uniref:3-deoxy-D-manno-octulosonic acid transferase n=1 Tax=Synergistes jonesii TaxID=2754 RepID=UPI0031E5BB99
MIPAGKISLLGGERPLWVHAVSVGEAQAAAPFIKAAREEGYGGKIVLSTTTQTGRAMAERLCSGLYDFHIYYPWDKTKFVRRALDSLRPAAFVAAETELWPNMLGECRERGVPAFLVNGRISDRTWRRISGALYKRIAARAYSLFDEILLRDEEDARRLSSIGVDAAKLHVTGDGKVDALLARKDFSARDEWLEKFGAERPIFMAGSTHAGEDEKALAAFESLRGALPDARLIIAPRHPERADAVCRLIPPKYVFAKLSQLTPEWDILIVDKIGVLFELYGTARAAFVGGSFTDDGGQNILEPFSWGVPVQYGPHMEDFAQASRAFLAMGAADQVADEKELADAWLRVAAAEEGAKWLELSRRYFEKSRGASARAWKIIKNSLAREENR